MGMGHCRPIPSGARIPRSASTRSSPTRTAFATRRWANIVLLGNVSGSRNVAVGGRSLQQNGGSDNIAIGFSAGAALTAGNHNIAIGHPGVAGESGIIRLGDPNLHTATFLAGTVNASSFAGDGSLLTGVVPADNSVSAAKLAAASVDNTKLANSSVTVTTGNGLTGAPPSLWATPSPSRPPPRLPTILSPWFNATRTETSQLAGSTPMTISRCRQPSTRPRVSFA
jgi:hypothetical protein